jgi:putative transposase
MKRTHFAEQQIIGGAEGARVAGEDGGPLPQTRDQRGGLRDEFLNETLFTSMMQARLALEEWRRDYNTARPHSRIGWLTPAAYAAFPNFCFRSKP